MTAVIAWLVKNWRLVVYAFAALAALWFVGLVLHWRSDSHKLSEVQAQLKAELSCSKGSECAARVLAQQMQQKTVTEQVVSKYEKELSDIRSRPVPRRAIRVCDDGNVRVAGGAGEPSEAEAGGVFHGTRELDTKPLRDAARAADEMNAAYRLLYDRDTLLAQPAK